MTRPKIDRPHRRFNTDQCSSGKRAYASRAAAKAAAKQWRTKGEHLRPYACRECDGWHVGHLPRRVLRGGATAAAYYGGRG